MIADLPDRGRLAQAGMAPPRAIPRLELAPWLWELSPLMPIPPYHVIIPALADSRVIMLETAHCLPAIAVRGDSLGSRQGGTEGREIGHLVLDGRLP